VPFLILFFFLLFQLEAKLPTYPFGEYPSQYKQFWFLYEKEIRKGQEEKIFRPFFSIYNENLSAHTYRTSLYPIYYSEKTNHWSKWTFLFFFSHDSTLHDDTGDDTDLVLSPLFQWGRGDTNKDRYVAFFPFYGKFRSKLSWGEINFILFPLYVDWQHKEFKARSFLYPLFMWGNSDIRSEFRLFPFYSKKAHIGKFEHYTVLWPFIQWGRDFMDKKEPSSYSLFFPFYNFKESQFGNMRSRAFFWLPILGSLFGYGYDRKTGEVSYNFLFFIFQYGYANNRDTRKHIFFPFYGYSNFASKSFRFITPFYINLQTDTYGVKSDLTYLIPFFIYNTKFFVKEEREDSYFKFWPLFRYHNDSEGNTSFNFFSPLPVRSTSFERIWDPIFSLFEYKKFINGEKRLSLFMRLYTQRTNEKEFHMYIPLLLDLSLEEEGNSFEILYGLIGYKKEEEKKTLHLLWFIKI
jgi:hypothetical protein